MNSNIERFKRITKIKLVLMCLATLLPILIVASLEAFLQKQFGYTYIILRYLVFALCEISIVLKIISYILILKNKDFCLKVHTKITDERNTFIRSKTSMFTIKSILFLNSLLLIIFGFIDPKIFIVLAAETIGVLIIFFASLYYYRKKY